MGILRLQPQHDIMGTSNNSILLYMAIWKINKFQSEICLKILFLEVPL